MKDLKKMRLKVQLMSRGADLVSWLIIAVTVIFTGMMPVPLTIVLRTLCAVGALREVYHVVCGIVDELKYYCEAPTRKHVTVDLKKGVITETK